MNIEKENTELQNLINEMHDVTGTWSVAEMVTHVWQAAKAQAVQEGFVLVKKEHLSETVEKIELMFEEDSLLALGELLPIQQGISAMIEAQE